jgi:hypothetical protein
MAKSFIDYTTAGTGTNGLGQTTFSYAGLEVLNDNDIKVFGEMANGTQDVLTISSRDTAAKTVTLSATPTSGYYTAKVRVYRSTTANALVDFVDGARLTESDLDTAYRQGLFVAQEVAENASGDGASGVAGLTENNLAESFYKEGTFTVTATPTGSGTVTLDTGFNTLSYTKIGNRVFVSGTLKVASVSNPVGALNLTTLPYTSSDITDKAGASISILNAQNPSGSNIDDFTGWIGEASTTLSIYYVETSDAANSTGNSSANKMQANTQLHINLNYITSS